MNKKLEYTPTHSLAVVRKFFPQVRTVEDATQPLTFTVSHSDGETAKTKQHNHCAMAVACERKTHADGVIVSLSRAYVIKGDKAVRYTVPEQAQREIVSFDRLGGFMPGEYRLNPPAKTARLGSERGGHCPVTGKGRHRKHVTKNVRTSLNEVKS